MYRAHNYEAASPEELPQDPGMEGEGWTFRTLEHGGPPVDDGGYFPHAILATDPKGRSHVYQATTVNGEPVHCKGYVFSSSPEARVVFDPESRDGRAALASAEGKGSR